MDFLRLKCKKIDIFIDISIHVYIIYASDQKFLKNDGTVRILEHTIYIDGTT